MTSKKQKVLFSIVQAVLFLKIALLLDFGLAYECSKIRLDESRSL